jgi:hypothetical protein
MDFYIILLDLRDDLLVHPGCQYQDQRVIPVTVAPRPLEEIHGGELAVLIST